MQGNNEAYYFSNFQITKSPNFQIVKFSNCQIIKFSNYSPMSKRTSKKIIAGITPEQYQDALSAYALADANAEKNIAGMNVEITGIREKYEAELTLLQAQKEKAFDVVQAYCMENKEALFQKIRHIETSFGKIGFRLGTPKLKTLPKYTWDRVLGKVETVLPQFVRIKKEVDKESILSNRATPEVAPQLAAIGVYVDQEESFFIDLKKESV